MKIVISFLILSFLGLAYSDKSPCQGCTDAVDGILKVSDLYLCTYYNYKHEKFLENCNLEAILNLEIH